MSYFEENLLTAESPFPFAFGKRLGKQREETQHFLSSGEIIASGQRLLVQTLFSTAPRKPEEQVSHRDLVILAIFPDAQTETHTRAATDFRKAVLATQAQEGRQQLDWLRENTQAYEGQWVALDRNRLIAAGNDAREVYLQARRQGITKPMIVKVGRESGLPFGGW